MRRAQIRAIQPIEGLFDFGDDLAIEADVTTLGFGIRRVLSGRYEAPGLLGIDGRLD